MNQALEAQLERIQQFDATHHRPMRIMDADDAQVALRRRTKGKKGHKKAFDPSADPFRRGLTCGCITAIAGYSMKWN